MTTKRLIVFAGAALLFLQSALVYANDAAGQMPGYDWRQTGTSLALQPFSVEFR